MFIDRIIDNFKVNEAIFADDILSLYPEYTKAYVYRQIKKAEINGKLSKFSRGVYYISKNTILGKSSITSSMVAFNKYVANGESIYGIYSGLSLLNEFAISSQVPNTIEIITNNEATRKRIVNIGDIPFIIRKSRFEITKNNCNYYAILELFTELGINYKLDSVPKRMIKEYIKNKKINKNKLFDYAMNFPAQTLKNLIRSGIIDGTI